MGTDNLTALLATKGLSLELAPPYTGGVGALLFKTLLLFAPRRFLVVPATLFAKLPTFALPVPMASAFAVTPSFVDKEPVAFNGEETFKFCGVSTSPTLLESNVPVVPRADKLLPSKLLKSGEANSSADGTEEVCNAPKLFAAFPNGLFERVFLIS